MIIFLGDSFTWGQGLPYYKWKSEGKNIKKICHYFNSHEFLWEDIDYKSQKYIEKHHYAGIVSRNLNKSYCYKWGNGGCNIGLMNILKNINVLHPQFYAYSKNESPVIELLVIQFTYATRNNFSDPNSSLENIIKKYNLDKKNIENIDLHHYIISNQIDEFKEIINKKFFNVPWICFALEEKYGKLLEINFPKNFLHIDVDKNRFYGLEKLLDIKGNTIKSDIVEENGDFIIDDSHLSKNGHKILANLLLNSNIVRKLQQNKII